MKKGFEKYRYDLVLTEIKAFIRMSNVKSLALHKKSSVNEVLFMLHHFFNYEECNRERNIYEEGDIGIWLKDNKGKISLRVYSSVLSGFVLIEKI